MKPEKRENRGINKRTRYDDEGEDEEDDDEEEEEYNINEYNYNNNNNNNNNSTHNHTHNHNNNGNENNLAPITNTPPKRMKIRFKIGNPNPVTLVYDEPPLQQQEHNNINTINNNNNNNNLFVPSNSTLSTTETLSEGMLTPTTITTNREKLPTKTKAISNNVNKPSIDQKKKAPTKRRDEEDGSEDFSDEEELDIANSDLDIMDDNLWEEEEGSDSVIDENEIEDDLDLDEDSNTPTSSASTSNSMNHNSIHSNKKLTSRQLAMQNGGSEELFSLPLGFQSKKAAANANVSVEVAQRKRAENAAKRKHQAQIDRDEQKDMIIAQLLNRSTKKKEDEREIKVLPVRYKAVQDSLRYVSSPSGNTLNIPVSVSSMTMSVFTPKQHTHPHPLTKTTATTTTTTTTPSETQTQITNPPFSNVSVLFQFKKVFLEIRYSRLQFRVL